MAQRVLVTGGTGFIGSHTCLALLDAGFAVTVVDDLSNSKAVVADRVRELSGATIDFHELDLRDEDALDALLAASPVDAVIHFAGLKAVGESVADPLRYYDVNVGSTMCLLRVLDRHDIRRVVFSSSATVYGTAEHLPLVEDADLSATNPYGRTKLIIEEMLGDVARSDARWQFISLRYFNPVGAHPSGLLGEDPLGTPNNLVPFALQVAVGLRPELVVFGDDYDTRDGTCIRDYIHVVDLAEGHVAALGKLADLTGFNAVNLGTGVGYTVLEVIDELGRAIGTPVAHRIGDRRSGDVQASYADPTKASDLLGWRATRSLADMCADAWRWSAGHPNGFEPTGSPVASDH